MLPKELHIENLTVVILKEGCHLQCDENFLNICKIVIALKKILNCTIVPYYLLCHLWCGLCELDNNSENASSVKQQTEVKLVSNKK